jgi:iron(III) transport system ATP-binding protein
MPEELSGGQQQRIAIARALVIDPQILLLDEPLSNLDAKLRISLRAQIREIQKKLGITAVYVTHDQEEALEISDRVAVMRGGEILQVGSPEDIYERPDDKFVADFVGKANLLTGTAEGGFFVCSPRVRVPYAGGAAKILMFRPEALTRTDAEPHVEGAIAASVYHGNIRRYLLDVGCDTPILYETREVHAVGETVRLSIDTYRLYE